METTTSHRPQILPGVDRTESPTTAPAGCLDDPICGADLLVRPAGAAEAAAALDFAHRQVMAFEVAELIAILHMADLWEVDSEAVLEGMERLITPGHDGTPRVGEFLALELGPLLGIPASLALSQIGFALDLRHRHPRLFQRVIAGQVRVWRARKVCQRCACLPLDACLIVDQKVADAVALKSISQAMKELEEYIISADQDLARRRAEAKRQTRFVKISPIDDGHVSIYGVVNPEDGLMFDFVLRKIAGVLPANPDPEIGRDIDLRRAQALGILCRHFQNQPCQQPQLPDAHPSKGCDRTSEPPACPRTAQSSTMPVHTLVVHINAADPALDQVSGACPPTGVARVDDWGPLLAEQLPAFLKDSKVIVRPIVDPTTIQPSDAYQTPDKMRFVIEQRNPVDVFPYGIVSSKHCDIDHTIAFRTGANAPCGQTRPDNLGPLSRKAHRAKTHSDFHLEQPSPGVFIWTTRLGYQYAVTARGTTRIQAPDSS
ncbi:DUF222 domain-containing protein [Brooklawnia sp.]|uniref:DUF222 domain-containing protein n=1 Tax=Brooklawnia sp. TaxID=2699740 RepID=UPI00311E1244